MTSKPRSIDRPKRDRRRYPCTGMFSRSDVLPPTSGPPDCSSSSSNNNNKNTLPVRQFYRNTAINCCPLPPLGCQLHELRPITNTTSRLSNYCRRRWIFRVLQSPPNPGPPGSLDPDGEVPSRAAENVDPTSAGISFGTSSSLVLIRRRLRTYVTALSVFFRFIMRRRNRPSLRRAPTGFSYRTSNGADCLVTL